MQFEWESGDRYFELEIADERTAEYLYCDDVARVEETGVVNPKDSLDGVIGYIRSAGNSVEAPSRQ